MSESNTDCKGSSPHIESELSRELSLFHLTMMGAGMMIGAGVFVATGISIGVSGSGGILVTFALNGLIALFSAMSYAEIASAMPAAGGAYTYIREAFGGVIGFVSGWMNWFALAVAGSLYAITFSTYTLHLLKGFEMFAFLESNIFIYEKILALGIAILFIAINFRGVSETGGSATMIALGQTVTLGIIGIIGIMVALKQPERLTNFTPFLSKGWGKILVTMGFTYVGFEGFEVIGHAGEEAINPKENIPKAILYAVVIVVITYMLVAFAAVVGVKPEGVTIIEWFHQRGATGFADAIKQLFPFGGILVTLAAIFSSTSALNATIYSAARVSFAMGRDGSLPKKLANISEKSKVPNVALFLSSIIVLVVAALLPVEDVAASADIMFLLIFLMINVAVIKIRREMGDELEYGFVMPFFPVIPIVALILQMMLAVWLLDMSKIAWGTTIVWITLGIIIYFTYAKKREKPSEDKLILEEKRDIKSEDYQVMVPISNPENAETLVNIASRICKNKNGEMVLMSVLRVPDQTPLAQAEQFICEKHDFINEVRSNLNSIFPVHSIIRYSHNTARGIISSVRERNSNMLVIGWKGVTNKGTFEMGKNLDRIIEGAPCDIMVVKPGESNNKDIKRILFPTNGGLHAVLSANIARILSLQNHAEIIVLNVNRNKRESVERIERRLGVIMKQLEGTKSILKIVDDEDVVKTIINESNECDLVVIGATQEGLFQQFLFGTIPEKIASGSKATVVLVKKDLGLKSWFKRWLCNTKC